MCTAALRDRAAIVAQIAVQGRSKRARPSSRLIRSFHLRGTSEPMSPVANHRSEARAPGDRAERLARASAVAVAALGVVLAAAGGGPVFLLPADEPRPPPAVHIGRAADWPEIKDGVPELVPSRTAGGA